MRSGGTVLCGSLYVSIVCVSGSLLSYTVCIIALCGSGSVCVCVCVCVCERERESEC